MRSGYENGYQVITLSDCVAATSMEEHDNALTLRLPDVLPADDVDGVHRGSRLTRPDPVG